MKTKLETLKEEFLNGNYAKAISIASKFPRLGNEKDAIMLAHGCITNPSFYKQIGKDIDKCILIGIEALRSKYEITNL